MIFDPNDWLSAVGPLKPDKNGYWISPSIFGPRDACFALKIRELISHLVILGESVPTDLFILSIGESPSRNCTKIGGLPFWRRDRTWPKSENGKPLPFLAQFEFRESTDITGNLPGEILLIFAHPDLHDGLKIEWETKSRPIDLVSIDDVPVHTYVPTFYGTRWRTINYPSWEPLNEHWSNIELADGTTVLDIYFALRFIGMQIGPSPFIPAWDKVAGPNERILCSLCSVFPLPNCIYPFLNYRDPLTEIDAQQFYTTIAAVDDGEGFGVIYIIAKQDGSFRWKLVQL